MPLVGNLIWDGWEWVRDNLLDQHGCYIQYLTKNGQPMDAGLSYNQGVAVGMHHSVDILPNLLGVNVAVRRDGHARLTTNDIMQALGWNEIDIENAEHELSMFVNQTNANILELSGDSPDPTPFVSPEVKTGVVEEVTDGDTIKLAGGDEIRVRLTGVDAPELYYKDEEMLNYNNPNNKGRQARAYLEKILITDQEALGYEPSVAIRYDPSDELDTYGRTLGVIYHNVPFGTPEDGDNGRLAVLEQYAGGYPITEWDSYLVDGRPYTANWALITNGYAYTDLGGLRFDQEAGGVALGEG